MGVLVRAVVSWLLTLGWVLLVAMSSLCLGFGNFVLAYESFKAQGFEPVPLRRLPLLGPWADGFGVGDAPVAALYALFLTIAMNLAIIESVKRLARTLGLILDLRQASRSSDPALLERVPALRDRAVHECLWSVALLVASVLILGWDLSQFNFNYLAVFDQAADPSEVLGWAPDLVQHVGHFVAGLISRAKWGYAGCVIALAVALEDARTRTSGSWLNLHQALDDIAEAPHVPTDESEHRSWPEPESVESTHDTGAQFVTPIPMSSNAGSSTEARTASTTDRDPVSPPPPVDPPPAVAPREDAVVDVIVGPGRVESFSLTEVQTDSARFVRDGSGRAWFLRAYWEELTGNKTTEGVGR